MTKKVRRIVWTRQARESVSAILLYRYSEAPAAFEIVKNDMKNTSKNI
ncbi:MAG TPA: hypothetical protein VLZ75_14135 [Chitinophagales bacterium]|nr:hypothetical protein [Chitinophagales bacterium]